MRTLLFILGLIVFGSPACAQERRPPLDWAGLTRYGSENTEIHPPAPGENRVIFLGDEISELWSKSAGGFFPGKPYLNRGISRQTTSQMLVRFRQDVILLKPKVVVILGGANDLAGITGPATEGTVAENLISMTELAQVNGIRVVLASVTPVGNCFSKRTPPRLQKQIGGLNAWMEDYATSSGSIYLDYYKAMADGGSLKKQLTSDGLLPNDAGYNVMARMAERAIARALGEKELH